LAQLLHNVAGNVGYFADRLGKLLSLLLVAASLSPLWLRPAGVPVWPRLLLPGFLLAYVLGVSLLTGMVARYATVLFPFALMQVAIELGVALRWWRERRRDSYLIHAAAVLLFALLLLTAPRTVLNAVPPVPGVDDRFVTRSSVLHAEPAFALSPVYTYVAGGNYRILPNDTLARVVHYAQLTGVRWLLVPRQPQRILDAQFYGNAAWLHDPEIPKRSTLLRFCCAVGAGTIEEHLVFEILPPR
jgi:hypothetical protein